MDIKRKERLRRILVPTSIFGSKKAQKRGNLIKINKYLQAFRLSLSDKNVSNVNKGHRPKALEVAILKKKNPMIYLIFFQLQCHEPDIHNYIICLMQVNKNKLKLDMLQQGC